MSYTRWPETRDKIGQRPRLIDGYLVQLSSERLPPEADGTWCRDLQPDIMWRESLNGRYPSNPFCQSSGDPAEKKAERVEGTRRTN